MHSKRSCLQSYSHVLSFHVYMSTQGDGGSSFTKLALINQTTDDYTDCVVINIKYEQKTI